MHSQNLLEVKQALYDSCYILHWSSLAWLAQRYLPDNPSDQEPRASRLSEEAGPVDQVLLA